MLLFHKPSDDFVCGFLESQRALGFSYPEVGATATYPPPGYSVDRTRIRLGQGERAFSTAKTALSRWEHFRLGWVEAAAPQLAIRQGEVVAVVARAAGLWWLNACRIVYVVDETAHARRFGFAYGTLPGHVESGEERFLIEWDAKDDTVSYEILAFSRPKHLLAKVGYPIARRMQKRFARDSAAAMLRAVAKPTSSD